MRCISFFLHEILHLIILKVILSDPNLQHFHESKVLFFVSILVYMGLWQYLLMIMTQIKQLFDKFKPLIKVAIKDISMEYRLKWIDFPRLLGQILIYFNTTKKYMLA